MKRKTWIFLFSAMLALGLTGCSGSGSSSSGSEAAPAVEESAASAEGETAAAGEEAADDLLSRIQSKGEIVVAMVEDSATVKRFFKEDGYYRLQPENANMDPILVPQVEILGKVAGLYRRM